MLAFCLVAATEFDQPVRVDLPVDQPRLEAATDAFRASLARARWILRHDPFDGLDALGKALAEPLRPWLEDRDTVVVCPSGAVSGIPFHLLPTGDGRRIIDHIAVTQAPSATMHAASRRRRAEGRKAVCLSVAAATDSPQSQALFDQEARQVTALLTSMNNLAETLRALGDLPGARNLQHQTLKARRHILGSDHPGTLTSMNNLAGTLEALGDLPGARDLHHQTLEARRRILGPDHPDTLTSMNNLAGTLGELGDLPGARDLQHQTLEAHCRILGPDHPDTLSSMNNLAGTLGALGDIPGARDLLHQTVEACCRILGPDHPDTLTSAVMLAQCAALSGDLAEARELAAWAARGLEAKLGLDHPQTQMARTVLARLTSRQDAAPDPG